MAHQITRKIAATLTLGLVFGCVSEPKPHLDDAVRQKVLNATLEIVPETHVSSTVGTAFSIGHGQFATAAHVLEDFIGSSYPPPVFRTRDGTPYPIDQIVKFTNEGDGEFAVVTLKDAPPIEALQSTDQLETTDPHWFAGRTSHPGIHIEVATLQKVSSKAIEFGGPVAQGFSGGPLFDKNGHVLGLISLGNPAVGWARTTLMIALDDAAPTLQLHAPALISSLGATRTPKDVPSETVTVGSSFEAFSAALITARQALYRRVFFDPDKPLTQRFVFTGQRSSAVCEWLNGAKCEAVSSNPAGAEAWAIPDTVEAPPPMTSRKPPVYTIHGATPIRDAMKRKAVPALREKPWKHLNLAHRCFEDHQLSVRLASSFDTLKAKRTLPQITENYPDTHGRKWTFRTWKLDDEDFFLVSLGRETDDSRGHIVLATVVPKSRVDGASVLLKYIANFTLSATGGVG